MKVSTLQPFRLVYALYQHEYLGYLFESFVVQINSRGEYTLQNQNISSKNINEFAERIDAIDFELVQLVDEIQQEVILKKFNPKKLKPAEFFERFYEKEDKSVTEAIHGYLEKYRAKILEKLHNRPIFIMGKDGDPTWQPIQFVETTARVYFHFDRQETETYYYPIIKCGDERIKFQFKGAAVLCEKPAYLLVENKLYSFENQVDGKKIKPFLNKGNIVISRKIEDTYFHKFVAPLIAQFRVFAKGFDIVSEKFEVQPQLQINEINALPQIDLFSTPQPVAEASEIVFDLSFQYGEKTFRYDSLAAHAYVNAEKKENDNWVFHKIRRKLDAENATISFLHEQGLELKTGRQKLSKNEAFTWLQKNANLLAEKGIQVIQKTDIDKQYFLGYSSFDLQIEETNDWFDIKAKVRFGNYEIPFVQLRKYILARKKEFLLPNGQYAVIPEEWFTRYSELMGFAETIDDEQFILKKHHITLLQDLSNDGLARTIMSRKLEKLQNFEEIEEIPLPKKFKGTLRPYQKAGYDWIHFLNKYNFGGCLADDMGLGKTVMTLAFLQSLKETENSPHPSLLVMPTSLIYNWQKEAQKFTPQLKLLIHTGANREKTTDYFKYYDLVLTSYGVLRIDIDFVKNYRFNYVILDESQAIKNPTSIISQAVQDLNSAHRLILTGTPLENSTLDLWSQMTFINPGLLGSQSFFKNNFQIPIERQKDDTAVQKLYQRIKPFMLRRQKSQVATELPEKVETIQYSDMTEDQEQLYEETKSYYRNLILDHIESKGLGKSQFIMLQGLMKLRQLANHPKMVDETFDGTSGKAKDITYKLREIIEKGHKVLIFSQFVKHLLIFRTYLDTEKIDYCYLDGATTDRQKEVERFQEDISVKIFLISLKAGGVGLNLTAAEYVFLLDPWWNPAIEAQAVDRAHRIGQKNTVFTYKFITRNSVEEKILALQNSKRKLFDDLITTEESFVKSLSKTDVLALLA